MLSITLTDRNFTVKNDIILSEGLTSITEDQIFVSEQHLNIEIITMLLSLQLPNYRIYILNMNSTLAKIVFCQVRGYHAIEFLDHKWIRPIKHCHDLMYS